MPAQTGDGAPVAHPVKPAASHRTAFLSWVRWGVKHADAIHYSEVRPIPVHLQPGTLPFTTDCSGYVTLMAKWAGCSDPNGRGFDGAGFTGTLLEHCHHITEEQARPGDLIVFGPYPGHHVVTIVAKIPDGDFRTVSHGREGDPRFVTWKDEAQYQPGPSTFLRWLSA